MEADELQIGRILRRHEILDILGTSGSVTLGGSIVHIPRWEGTHDRRSIKNSLPAKQNASNSLALNSLINSLNYNNKPLFQIVKNEGTLLPDCVVQPEYRRLHAQPNRRYKRRDIRNDCVTGSSKEGVALELEFQIWQINAEVCQPFAHAIVNIWHCDAIGNHPYLHEMNPSVGHYIDPEQTFLRGQQVSDQEGSARFITIVPGCYEGRTAHIHFQVRVPYARGSAVFVSQLFFDDLLLDQIYTQEPYIRSSRRDTRNNDDQIYEPLLRLELNETERGYQATFALGIDMSRL